MNVLAKLECGYIVKIRASMAGTPWFCYLCGKEQRVIDIITREIHVKCGQCSFARWAGLSSFTGNDIANRHARACNHHQVTVTAKDNPEAVRVRAKLTERRVL